MIYADIEYSKQLAKEFPDSEWWWVKYIEPINGVNTQIDWYIVNQGRFNVINEGEPCNFQSCPALTTDMLLEWLPKEIDKNNWYHVLSIFCFPDVFEVCYTNEDIVLNDETIEDKSLPNALAKLLIWLKTEGLLK